MAEVNKNVAALNGIINEAINNLPVQNSKKGNDIYVTRKDLLQIMNKVFEGHVDMMLELKREVKEELMEEITALKTENVKLKKQLLQTNIDHENLSQYINRDTLKICNVVEPTLEPNQQENVNETVKTVLDKAGIPFDVADISVAHRLPVSRGSKLKHKSIICKIKGRDTRNAIIKMKKEK